MKQSAVYLALVCLSSTSARAQVPRFEPSPDALISRIGSLDKATRLAAVTQLAQFRDSNAARRALAHALLQDPEVKVRQAAAVGLAKLRNRAGTAMLRYAAVCDPDPATRKGLAAQGRQAGVQCDNYTHPVEATVHMPRSPAQRLRYLSHPASRTRLRALRLLARHPSAAVRRAMWDMATKDPYWAVRVDALRAIAPLYKTKMLPLLSYIRTGDPDGRVRRVSFEVLAFIADPRSAADLAQSVSGEATAPLQLAALDALAKLPGSQAARALAALAGSHPAETIRAKAIGALAARKDQARYTRQVLARVLARDASGKVRAAALEALSTDRGRAACEARVRRISDPDQNVRRVLVKQLDGCPAGVARPALERVLLGDKQASVRRAALTLLARSARKDALPLLRKVLERDSDRGNRQLALDTLERVAPAQRERALVAMAVGDADAGLRERAVRELGALHGHLAIDALVGTLKRDPAVPVRLAAARSLAGATDERVFRALRQAAQDDGSNEVRAAAAAAAAKSPARKTWVTAMLARTTDVSPEVRLAAAKSLCALHAPRTYRALVRLMWVDPQANVRAAVASCFADNDSPLIDVALSVAHGTESNGTVVRAIEASQRQRTTRLAALLEQAARGKADARARAIASLLPGPQQNVRKALEAALLKDPDQRVRRAAADKLYRYADQRALAKLALAGQQEQDPSTRQSILGLHDDLRRRWASAKQATNLGVLLGALQSGTPQQRLRATQTLGALRDRRAFQPLQRAAASSDGELRYAAIVALATFGDVTIVSKHARTEASKGVRDRLIQLNFLRKATPDRVIAAVRSSETSEVMRGIEAAAIKKVKAAVPYIAKVAISHLDKDVRRAAARTLVQYETPLAYWTVRVASSHDASKALRRTMWGLAVLADGGAS